MVAMNAQKAGATSDQLPDAISKRPLPARIAWLDSQEAAAALTSSARKRIRKTLRIELDLIFKQAAGPAGHEREAARAKLRLWTCSDCWQEVIYLVVEAWGVIGGSRGVAPAVRSRLRRAGAYPPGGESSRMKTCHVCGRDMPPNCIGSSGACDECRYEAMTPFQAAHLPSSTSAVLIYQLPRAQRGIVRQSARTPDEIHDSRVDVNS